MVYSSKFPNRVLVGGAQISKMSVYNHASVPMFSNSFFHLYRSSLCDLMLFSGEERMGGRRISMVLKSRQYEKTYLGPILNIY